MAVDRQLVARTLQELRRALPQADDLLAGLLRVAEATSTVLEVDGAALTLVHADGPPRSVTASPTNATGRPATGTSRDALKPAARPLGLAAGVSSAGRRGRRG